MFRFLIRFLFLILALRIVVDVWRRLTGRRPEPIEPGRAARPGRDPRAAGSSGAPGSQGPVQGRPEMHQRMRASLDREDAVDVPFVEVGANGPETSTSPQGADRS